MRKIGLDAGERGKLQDVDEVSPSVLAEGDLKREAIALGRHLGV